MHDNHRERMREKMLSGAKLAEHEVLELLLYYALPRVNTNPIAHNLIEAFGTLDGVLAADSKLLQAIDGVGENVAAYLKTLGAVLNDYIVPEEIEMPKVFSFEQMRKPMTTMYKHVHEEIFIAFFLDAKQRVIARKTFCDHSKTGVTIDLNEFYKEVVIAKPTYVAIVHNHLSGVCFPSKRDDDTTLRLCILLMLNNISLVDHLIVSGDDVYSYFYDNRIEAIKSQASNFFVEEFKEKK